MERAVGCGEEKARARRLSDAAQAISRVARPGLGSPSYVLSVASFAFSTSSAFFFM